MKIELNVRRAMIAAALLAGALVPAWAAGIFQGLPTVGGANAPGALTGIECVPADTNLAQGLNPATVCIPSSLLANLSGTPRNYLDNGALNVTAANGTSTVTGQINASAAVVANMAADRWLLSTNVASGAGRTAIVTSSPTPPAGFTNVMKVFRTSGALTQPICVWQEVPTAIATQLAGKNVVFSAQVAALAGLAADNNNQMSLVILTGTGADQAFGTWTASPAITPAWTGIATAVNATQNVTTTFTRYNTTAAIPAAATEVAAGLCFTPTATGAGATDGFAWVGAQLEVGTTPSAFEVLRKSDEISRAQQFLYVLTESATLVEPHGVCHFTTANTVCQWGLVLPQPMYLAPAITVSSAGFAVFTTTAETTASNCVALAASATVTYTQGAGQNVVQIQCSSISGTTAAVGLVMTVIDNNNGGSIKVWAGM